MLSQSMVSVSKCYLCNVAVWYPSSMCPSVNKFLCYMLVIHTYALMLFPGRITGSCSQPSIGVGPTTQSPLLHSVC